MYGAKILFLFLEVAPTMICRKRRLLQEICDLIESGAELVAMKKAEIKGH